MIQSRANEVSIVWFVVMGLVFGAFGLSALKFRGATTPISGWMSHYEERPPFR